MERQIDLKHMKKAEKKGHSVSFYDHPTGASAS